MRVYEVTFKDGSKTEIEASSFGEAESMCWTISLAIESIKILNQNTFENG